MTMLCDPIEEMVGPGPATVTGEITGEYTKKRLTSVDDIRRFVFGGKATLTLVSKASGSRFTFKVTKPKAREDGVPSKVSHFVALMNGSDNENNFAYLGHVYASDEKYAHGAKSKIGTDAAGAKAWAWFYAQVVAGKKLRDDVLEVWHEGRCCRCGRKLTVPASIANGIGPECATKE